MQIPSMDIRELKADDALRSDEVAITAEQRSRILVSRVPLPEGHRWCDACSGQGVLKVETPPEPVSPAP